MRIRFVSEIPRSQIISRPGAAPLESAARRAAAAVLRHEKVRSRQDLNVVWTSQRRIRALNRRFRGVDAFTDVISFRYDGASRGDFKLPSSRPPSFGDLFISVPQARQNARRFGVPPGEELLRLVVHGTLHLLGYTDYVPREKKKMWAVQEKILKKVIGRQGPAFRKAFGLSAG